MNSRIKTQLRTLLDSEKTIWSRRLAWFIQFMILVSLVSLTIESLPGLSETTNNILAIVELITIIVFTLEYAARIYASKKPAEYIFSWWGMIDLIAILPYYLALGLDLREMRAFRLVRILRLLKMKKFNHALGQLAAAFNIAKTDLLLSLGFAAVILYISAIGIHFFEHEAQPEQFKSVPHSLWWALVTLTTLGYGDMYPQTAGGKIFASIVVLVGLGFVAMPASIMTSAFNEVRLRQRNKQKKTRKKQKKPS